MTTLPIEHHHDAQHTYYTAEQLRACIAAEREKCAAQLEAFADKVAPAGRFNSSFDARVAYVLRQQAREMRGYA